MQYLSATAWAQDEFGRAELGDARRRRRLVAMAARLAEHPAGKVTQAFTTSAERQGAYGLLAQDAVRPEDLSEAAGNACARRGADEPLVLLALDGTSAHLSDPQGRKGFGVIGTYRKRAHGLKVLSAIALSPAGVPLGVAAQRTWMRSPQRPVRRSRWQRRVHEKETQHWLDVIDATVARFAAHAPQTRGWFQLDREADAWPLLVKLAGSGHWFTVRAAWNRRVWHARGRSHLREVMARQPVLGGVALDVTAAPRRTARRAHLGVRVGTVVLDLRDKRTDRRTSLTLNVVWAREVHTTPRQEKPLEWMLLTNYPVATLAQASRVLDGYALRWRIEDVHRTWKSGGCDIEASQLHSEAAVRTWATLLFCVATRIERLKHLARTAPNQPASVELSPSELRALVLLKRREKKRTETIPNAVPTLSQAVRWIADLGGYTGTSSGGPPGSITIGRGFERVLAAAAILEALDDEAEGQTKM